MKTERPAAARFSDWLGHRVGVTPTLGGRPKGGLVLGPIV